MKKFLSVAIVFALVFCLLPGCGSPSSDLHDGEKLKIVTTIFPEYDWIMTILGDAAENAEVSMLLDNGVDLHSYQPTADDMVKISTCDIFIYVGGESDDWVADALQEAVNKDMVVVNLLETLGDAVKEEELIEGMEAEDEEDAEDEEIEYDEHVWLSLRNAGLLCASLADKLGQLDPTNKAAYDANAAAYIEKLNTLDATYQAAVDAAGVKTVLFGDRFPFRYLVDDYGLNYYVAFAGCSAETEASFETIRFLADKVDQLHLHTVLTIEGTNHRIAETIVNTTESKDAQILTLNSLQSITSKDVADGASYLAIMESNLDVLKAALR